MWGRHPAYRETLGLEPWAEAKTELGEDSPEGAILSKAVVVRHSPLVEGKPRAFCWAPETGQSPESSGVVKGFQDAPKDDKGSVSKSVWHIFGSQESKTHIWLPTDLGPEALWDDPGGVAGLLARWLDQLGWGLERGWGGGAVSVPLGSTTKTTEGMLGLSHMGHRLLKIQQ